MMNEEINRNQENSCKDSMNTCATPVSGGVFSLKSNLWPNLIFVITVIMIVVFSGKVFGSKSYAAASFLMAAASCIFLMFRMERHVTHLRRILLICVMTSLSVISRFLFYPIPGFKPMTAIIILTGVYMGGEAGFLCGAMTALVSNIYFGQGPWTPFQMLAFGLLGFMAGILAKWLKNKKLLLAGYGLFAGCLYSFVMDVWTVLWFDRGFEPKLYLTAIVTAMPYTILYAVSTAFFLLILRKTVGARLNRVIHKYRI